MRGVSSQAGPQAGCHCPSQIAAEGGGTNQENFRSIFLCQTRQYNGVWFIEIMFEPGIVYYVNSFRAITDGFLSDLFYMISNQDPLYNCLIINFIRQTACHAKQLPRYLVHFTIFLFDVNPKASGHFVTPAIESTSTAAIILSSAAFTTHSTPSSVTLKTSPATCLSGVPVLNTVVGEPFNPSCARSNVTGLSAVQTS